MVTVTFQIENEKPVSVSANDGDKLLEVARLANVAIDAPCSGNGSCGKCRVKLLEGELDSIKSSHISEEEYNEGFRLACCSKVKGDVRVFVPDIASAYRSRMKTADLSSGEEIAIFERMKKEAETAGITAGTDVFRLTLELSWPTLDDTLPDNERVEAAIMQQTGCSKVVISFYAMKQMASVLRSSGFRTDIIGERDGETVKVLSFVPTDSKSPVCAIAVDIGTTTVAAVLVDIETGDILSKASTGNGQIRYGADVINRIVEQGKPGGREKLQKAIVNETLIPLFDALLKDAGISKDYVARISIASNTTMNHLLLGVDAEAVRMEPYIPSFFEFGEVHAGDLLFPLPSADRVIISPNVGSYVGGDITAGAFASLLWNRDEFSLFVDLGTNGEIVFGNSEFLMTCACSAGPAFEGGDISCGMRATDGAIEAVELEEQTLTPKLRIVGGPGQKPVGVCGSGIIDVIAELFRTGAIDPKGKFVKKSDRVLFDENDMGRFVLASSSESQTGREISISEVDIESFIRAKGAIYSAIDTMLQSLDFTPDMIEHVYVAGGIGSGINMNNAVRIGMFPDIDREKYEYIGNSSLSGAYMSVLSLEAEKKISEIGRNMTYLELSTHPGYMEHFVAACFLPHTDVSLFPSIL